MGVVTVRGRRPTTQPGTEDVLQWADGRVTGPPAALTLVAVHVAAGTPVGDPGVAEGPASLSRGEHPAIVAGTLALGLSEVTAVVGVPETTPLPDGTVA